ncbi:hypothetical protein A2U01_0119570, partial [Trifolium medium]|nr:hypothetical protein [Trifolium medium]
PVSAPQYQMPDGFPWGMPFNFVPEGYQPVLQHVMTVPPHVMTVPPPVMTVPPPAMIVPPPVVHTVP